MHFPLSSYIVLHPPHFFTVVLQLNLDHKKLMIPENFIRDYGKFLSNSASLKLPDGKEWEVELTRATNGAVWLQNGWHEFAEYYGLEFGSFLVFRFDGDSTFHTMIFDTNGSEIKYSCKFVDSNGISLKPQPQPKPKKEKASFPSLQSRKKMRNDEDSFRPKMEPQEQEGYNIFRDIPSSKNRIMPKQEHGVSMKMQPLNKKLAEAAQKFGSKAEKPGFKVVMRQSNVGGRFEMIIPREFAGKYLSEEFGMIRLQTSNGRTWSLVYKWNRNQGNFAYISSGWKRFAEENLLKEGDIGFFQLIQKDQFLFTKLQHFSPSSSPKNKITTTKNPSFEVDINFKHYSNPILLIPKRFGEEHFSPEMHTAKLAVGNKQWKVKVKQYNNRFRFSAGWAAFYKDNRLEDTTCLFEMVNKKDCVFKVTIFNDISSTSVSESEED